jgi:F420-0:gamma-glutamyl ligase
MRLLYCRDQTVAEILTDTVTKMVMEADGIDAKKLEAMLRLVAQNSPAVSSRRLQTWLTRRR